MDPSLQSEIIGDWNNLKGTAYHFAYALWRLLHEQHVALEFYRGNDLLACAAPPPHPDDTQSSSCALHISGQIGDEWIQLKATTTAWSPTELLKDNLLLNFICNALTSEAQERQWRAQLISQAEVRRSVVLAFIEDPQRHPVLASQLDRIVCDAQDRWEQGGNSRPDDAHVRELAYAILRQLAEQQPTHLDTLKAQIELALAYRYLTPRLVEQTRRLLLGGLLNDAASGPHHARTYDSAWLDATAGRPIRPTGIFDLQPGDACDRAVRDVCETLTATSVVEQQFVVRSILADEFARFLSSPYTIFVLVGDSGVGKSWALADWMMHGLAGRMRLLIPGTELDLEQQRELSALVAGRLRPYSADSQQDDELLLRLEAAAREHRRGPLILALDDLQPIGDIEIYRRSLLRLVSQCRVRGVKLVLTCQTQVWDMYRLERAVPVSDRYDAQAQRFSRITFSPQASSVSDAPTHASSDSSEASQSDGEPSQRTLPVLATGQSSLPYTLALGDFTPEEQQQALASRLSAPAAERAALALRAAPFLSLRRPYLLDLYVRQYGQRFSATSYSAVPVDVDALVDSHINDILSRVADATTIDEEVIRSASESLAAALWSARPDGISLGHAEGCLTPIVGGRSQGTLDAMRRAGLLTSRGQVRFAETQVAERVFARNLAARQATGEDIIADLRPEPDAGVAAALLRVSPTDGAVAFAEELLRRNARWSGTVASGLAQVSSPDTGVLALLTIMTRLQENVIGVDGCAALGALAARDACALKWVTAMYVAAHGMERYRGARALAATFEYAPERVEAAVRLRLAGAARIDVSSSSGREEREEWLRQSLTPLLNVRHVRAAAVARRLLARCAPMCQGDKPQVLRQFEREMNEIRGQIALFDAGEMERIQTDVRSPESALRVRAAVALRSAMLDEPERVQNVICEAITRELDPVVLTQLLWATSRLSESCPDQLLNALSNSTTALNWAAPSETAGQALATLSNLATSRSERVVHLLPQRLDAYPAWSRAWLAEGLAYAWWVCAERAPNARAPLERFVTPELLDIPEECQIFAWKAAALAQLGLLCLQSEISTSELSGLQILYPGTRMQFCFVHTVELVQRHARNLVNMPEISRLIDLLRRCEAEFARVPTNPLQRALVSARHTCAEQCFEMLIALAIVHADPIPLISELRSDWHTFGAARRLLESGRTEQSIQAYVRTLCDAAIPVTGRSIQALGEWERCVQQLADITDTPQANVGETSTNLHDSPFGADDRVAAMAQRMAAHPDDLLSILDSILVTERKLVTLYFLPQHARSWPALLLARVYARMFDLRPLTIHEAQRLCDDVFSALAVLPDSAERDEYAHVYAAIASWLAGMPCDAQPTGSSASPSSPIGRSHAAAVTMIHDAFQRLPNRPDAAHLSDALATSRDAGWWEVDGMRLHGDTISVGTGSVLYVFPAVRLALCGLWPQGSSRDTAAMLLTERIQVQKLLSRYHYELDPRLPFAEGYLEKNVGKALEALSDPTLPQTRDERLYMAQSTLLRRLGRLDEAIQILERGLWIFGEFPSIRASMLYELGCAYALCGRDDDCRDALQAAAQLAPFTGMRYQWLFEDPELAAVRDKPWLRELGQSQVSSHEGTQGD